MCSVTPSVSLRLGPSESALGCTCRHLQSGAPVGNSHKHAGAHMLHLARRSPAELAARPTAPATGKVSPLQAAASTTRGERSEPRAARPMRRRAHPATCRRNMPRGPCQEVVLVGRRRQPRGQGRGWHYCKKALPCHGNAPVHPPQRHVAVLVIVIVANQKCRRARIPLHPCRTLRLHLGLRRPPWTFDRQK